MSNLLLNRIDAGLQIRDGSFSDSLVPLAGLSTAKLADGANFLVKGGTVAMTADFNAGGFKVKNLATGVLTNDAVTVGQLNAVVQGLQQKKSVRTVATVELTNGGVAADFNPSEANEWTSWVDWANTSDGALIVNGVTLTANAIEASADRILVAGQTGTNAKHNGIFYAVENDAVNYKTKLCRTSDADSDVEVLAGTYMFVEEGTVGADKGYSLITNNPIELGVTALEFTIFNALPPTVTVEFRDVVYVDSSTTTETGNQTGAAEAPFATIQQALDHIGVAVDAASYQQRKAIYVMGGATYTENLTVPYRSITIFGRGITISGNVTRHIAPDEEFGVSSSTFRAGLTFMGLMDSRDSHNRLRNGITITGNFRNTLKSGTTTSTHDTAFVGTRINGTVTDDDGTVNSGAPATGSSVMYFNNSRIAGGFEGRSTIGNRWNNVEVNGAVTIGAFANISNVSFDTAITLTNTPAGFAVTDNGWNHCKFAAGQHTIPSGTPSYTMDAQTATSWKAATAPVNAYTITYLDQDKGIKNNSSITGESVYDALTTIAGVVTGVTRFTSAAVMIGQGAGSNAAAYALSGDATMSSTGVVTISATNFATHMANMVSPTEAPTLTGLTSITPPNTPVPSTITVCLNGGMVAPGNFSWNGTTGKIDMINYTFSSTDVVYLSYLKA